MKVPKTIKVTIDTREQYPMRFPTVMKLTVDRLDKAPLCRVREVWKALKEADYCLTEWPSLVGIERKGSLSEIQNNLFTEDRERTLKAFSRFATAYKHKYLLIDCSLNSMYARNKYVPNPDKVIDELFRLSARYGFSILWAGNCKTLKARIRLGGAMIRIMWAHVVQANSLEI